MSFGGAAYFDKVLKLFILLQQFFEDIHSLCVMAAELAVHLLHFLCIFIWKLRKKALSDWCLSAFTGKNVSSTNLLKQHISNLIDKIILRTVRLGSSLSPFL